ncbi:transposase IS66 family protein [Escherichia coli DEC2C]|nr:transposase IS66 family protein [Escherichia coli DEC2C]
MDTSLAHENARLRALLQTQQDTIRQMAEYNRLLSQRVAAYASEINRLKALVAKLQRMQFGKSSEKLRAKTERQIQEAQERISALQEEMAETLGEQYDPVLPSALRQSSARKPLPASLPRETRVIRPEEECCPACGGELSSLGCDVSEQLELISSAFKVIETQRPKQACCRCDHIVQAPVPSKPIARSYAGAGLLAHVVTGKYADHLPLYRQSEIYRRQGVELSRATLGRWTGAVAELLEPLYDVLRQYVLMPGKVHADDIPVPVQEPGSGKTRTARLWVYVRDDRNAGSQMPPAVWFAYSPDRKGIHPQKSPGRLQRCASGRCLRWLPGVIRIRQNNGKPRVWLMPGEKSTMCMQERPPTSPRKPCSVSVNCMPSRQRSGAVQQNSVWRQEKPEPRH